MDSRATAVSGAISPELITGRRIITSNNVPLGEAWITNDYILCRPTHSLVWPTVWKRIVSSERQKAMLHLEAEVMLARRQLGLPLYYLT
jgi:hypothetical protein